MAWNEYMKMMLRRSRVLKRVLCSSSAASAGTIAKPERKSNGMSVPQQLPPFDFTQTPCNGPPTPAHEILEKRRQFMILGIIPYYKRHGLLNALPVITPWITSVPSRARQLNMFGGKPVCPAVPRLEKEGPQHCTEVSTHMIQLLNNLKDKHEIIGEIKSERGLIGVELVKDRSTKEPAKEATSDLYETMKGKGGVHGNIFWIEPRLGFNKDDAECGVLVGKGGEHGNIFWIKPRLGFNKDDADFLVKVMDYHLCNQG